jgi:hypothetical protein
MIHMPRRADDVHKEESVGPGYAVWA